MDRLSRGPAIVFDLDGVPFARAQATILKTLSEFAASAGRPVTISEAFQEVAKRSMASCLRRANTAYTLKVCTVCHAHNCFFTFLSTQILRPSFWYKLLGPTPGQGKVLVVATEKFAFRLFKRNNQNPVPVTPESYRLSRTTRASQNRLTTISLCPHACDATSWRLVRQSWTRADSDLRAVRVHADWQRHHESVHGVHQRRAHAARIPPGGRHVDERILS